MGKIIAAKINRRGGLYVRPAQRADIKSAPTQIRPAGVKIYIILPVHNRLESTKRFVASLLAQSYTDYHLLLIDDGSTDGTADFVKQKVKALTVITGKGDWWWGGGLHQGYLWLKEHEVSRSDLVLMINNDTEFERDFLKAAVDLQASRQRTLLLARGYSRKDGSLIESGVHADWQRLLFKPAVDAGEVNCLSTRGLFLRVSDLMIIGGFHPVVLPHYLSDYEFTIRAGRKGFQLMTHPDLRLTVDEVTTGYHSFEKEGQRGVSLRKYFSKRSANNPLYWFFFVALACPWPFKPVHLLRVIYGGLKVFFVFVGSCLTSARRQGCEQ